MRIAEGMLPGQALEGGVESAGPPAAPRPRGRFSTRRRLILAFGAVLAGFLSALALELVGLRRMEAEFAEMKDHEEQMVIALRLEDAVRDQYGHALRFAMGEASELERYEEKAARAGELSLVLIGRVDEPDVVLWLKEIRDASAEIDRAFREQVAPAAARRDPAARVTVEESYPLVSLIDRNVDRIIGRLHESSSACRKVLAELEDRAARWTAVLLVAAPLFVAAAVLYLSRSVARPLARLSERAAAFAGGRRGTRIEIDTPDEFGALAAEFNAMTVAVEQQQAKLVESEKLAGIGRLAAGVAHELNNPLQVMLGYLSLNREVPDRRLAEQLAAVEAETLRCKDIVDGLLELSRPAATAVPVDLRALCEDASGRLRISARPDALRPSIDGEALALADPKKVGQVVFNLVKNAAEAAGPAGDVSIRIRAAGEVVEVAVRDSGPGIAPEARNRIFEPFYTTKPAGTGLGLAVSRAIARAHGGDIDVRNGEAGGAVFTLRLPRAPEARS